MKISIGGHEMNEEEVMDRIVNLEMQNAVHSALIGSLITILLAKEITDQNELDNLHGKILEDFKKQIIEQGGDPEKFMAYAKDSLEL